MKIENRIILRDFNELDMIPTRLSIAVMIFITCFCAFMLRVNMSINILAMVQQTNANGTQIEMPNYGPRYPWTKFQQSSLLGAYFWGYAITSIPFALLCQRYGSKRTILYSFSVSALLTALSPVLAQFSFWISFAIRFLIGSVCGGMLPAVYYLISKWSPPDERGKFTSAMLGGSVGMVVTWPLVGKLIETVGWNFGFYVPAILMAGMTMTWWYVTYDSPAQHPRISVQEKEYIESRLVGNTHTKNWPPLLLMAQSIPFWALFMLHYGSMWGMYFLVTGAPKFMNEVLGFNMGTAGVLASLPNLARFFSGIAFGSIGDIVKRRQILHVTNIRKLFCIFSHVAAGLCLLAIPYAGDKPYVCVAFITLSLGFNGASTVTNLQNAHDLTPNYATTMFSIINTVATSAGFLSPLVVAYFTKEHNTVKEWSRVFQIGAMVYILPAIFFILFGSGDIQRWNEQPVLLPEEVALNYRKAEKIRP